MYSFLGTEPLALKERPPCGQTRPLLPSHHSRVSRVALRCLLSVSSSVLGPRLAVWPRDGPPWCNKCVCQQDADEARLRTMNPDLIQSLHTLNWSFKGWTLKREKEQRWKQHTEPSPRLCSPLISPPLSLIPSHPHPVLPAKTSSKRRCFDWPEWKRTFKDVVTAKEHQATVRKARLFLSLALIPQSIQTWLVNM